MRQKLFVIIAFAVAIFNGIGVSAAEDPYRTLFRESRMIRDAASLNLYQMANLPEQNWVVLAVHPSPTSGTVKDAQRDALGKVVKTPKMTPAKKVVEGTLELIATLNKGQAVTLTDYKWEISGFLLNGAFLTFSPGTDRNDDTAKENSLYNPFTRGGVIICQIHQDVEWPHKVNPVYLIPTEWQKFASSALEFQKNNIALFRSWSAGEIDDTRKDSLEKLLNGENPFLSLAAWRVLSAADKSKVKDISSFIVDAETLKQAAFVYSLLTSSPNADSLTTEIVKIIEATNDLNKIRGIALGAYAAPGAGTMFGKDVTKMPPLYKNSFAILRKVGDKQKSLAKQKPEVVEYISTILRASGLVPNTPTPTSAKPNK